MILQGLSEKFETMLTTEIIRSSVQFLVSPSEDDDASNIPRSSGVVCVCRRQEENIFQTN
jgi:hypothetical protein